MTLKDILTHLLTHWADVLTGATVIGVIAHAVNTFPVPTNAYAKWLLGVVQFAVGQREKAEATMATAPAPVPPTHIPVPSPPIPKPPSPPRH